MILNIDVVRLYPSFSTLILLEFLHFWRSLGSRAYQQIVKLNKLQRMPEICHSFHRKISTKCHPKIVYTLESALQTAVCSADFFSLFPHHKTIDMFDVAAANVNGWDRHNHNKPGAPCDRCETAVALPRGVETDFKREVRVATGRNGKNEKNKKNEIKCAATGTESNIDRSCYGCVGSTTSCCAASATRFDPTMKGKA